MGNQQSLEYIKETPAERDGETAVFVNPRVPHFDYHDETLGDLWVDSVKKHKDLPFLGTRVVNEDGSRGEYAWKTYQEIFEASQSVGTSLVKRNLAPEVNDQFPIRFVGVLSKNREEYVILIEACILYGITTVPLYDTLGPDAIEYIVNHTKMSTLFTTRDSVNALVTLKSEKRVETLRNIVVMGEAVEESVVTSATSAGLEILSFESLNASEEKGEILERVKSKPDDVYYISYTSGTTGPPKAAMITHKNMYHNILANSEATPFLREDVGISYLPLAHIAESAVLQTIILNGISTGFYSGDPRIIADDLATLKPTVLPGVPKVFNRFHDLIKSKFREAAGVKKNLLERALAAKLDKFSKTGDYTHWLYDRLIFSKVRGVLGGRVRIIASGAAPLHPDVATFLQICFCCPISQMYGQTENTGPCTITLPGDPIQGHAGGPLASYQMKLVDIPEMNYRVTDQDAEGNPLPRGEVCVKGPGVFRGYYRDEVKTKEAIDADGWLHSGDVGSVDLTGRIRIIDRKKALFKLSQGEYVSPEKVENIYLTSKYIAQAWVYGDSLRDYTVAVIVPDELVIVPEAEKELGLSGSFAEIIKHESVQKLILDDMKSIGKTAGLKGFEAVRKIYLASEPWTPDTGIMTPTFKIKRNIAKERFENELEALYKDQFSSQSSPR